MDCYFHCNVEFVLLEVGTALIGPHTWHQYCQTYVKSHHCMLHQIIGRKKVFSNTLQLTQTNVVQKIWLGCRDFVLVGP